MSECILVVGAGGFIGRHLVRALAGLNEPVIALCRRRVGLDLPNCMTEIGELREPESISKWLPHCRVVVYLASSSTPGESAARPVHEVVDNLGPLVALLQALQDRPSVALLYLSSGGSLYASANDSASDETGRILPKSYHGAGKAAAEYFISAWCQQYAGKSTILRPSNIYGPGQLERAGFGIVPAGLGVIRRGETLHVWGNGSAIRDYLYIDDLVGLMTTILARPMSTGTQIVNGCSGIDVSLNELFAEMEAVTGLSLNRKYEAGRTVDASRVVMDPALASRLYDWAPAVSLHEGLERTWTWLNTTH